MYNLLWSDPHTPEEIKGLENDLEGILLSRPPFTQDDSKRFLERVNLKHIIRAHKLVNTGYQDKFDDKSVITVFSSANYCMLGNIAAIMEYNSEDYYRIIQFDDEKVYEPIQFGGVNKQ